MARAAGGGAGRERGRRSMGGRRAETGGGPTRQGAVAVSCRDHGGRPRRPGLGAPSAPARRPGGGATPRRARIARGRGMPGRHARGRARQDGGRGAATRPRGWTAGGPASAPDVRPRLGARAAGRVVGGVLPAVRRLARAPRGHGPRARLSPARAAGICAGGPNRRAAAAPAGVRVRRAKGGSVIDSPLTRPSAVCRDLLAALEASEGRRQRRKRDTTPDAIGHAIKRGLLEQAVAADPAPEEFEAWLQQQCFAAGPGEGGVRAMALSIFEEWRLAHEADSFRDWLARGAPSDDAPAGQPARERTGTPESSSSD